jgi:membrane protein DedA with SNARE-associated domain/membrane-associated phospholipid phosphatase
VSAVLEWLGGLPPLVVYLATAFVVFAETGLLVGLVAPGEITLLTVGFLAYRGLLSLPLAVVVMVLAGLAGDAVAYADGRRTGPRLRTSRLGVWVGARRWARADALLRRYGGRAVAVSRFIAFARTLAPRLAGMSGVAYRQILVWDVLGVLGWVGGSVVAGYLAGTSYARLADVFGQATSTLLLLVLVIVALVVIGRYFGRHRNPVSAFTLRVLRTRPLRGIATWYTVRFRRLTDRLGPDGALVANLALGSLALLGIGFALAWAISGLVRHSGVPLVDPFVDRWLAAHRSPATVDAARVTLAVLRGSYLVIAVAIVGVVLNPRPRTWRTDLLALLGTAGAFIPLLILAAAADWARPAVVPQVLLPNQVTVVTASLGLLARLIARRLPWAGAVAVWFTALGGVLLVDAARLYLGLDWLSQVIGSTLLGALWVLVFVVAWYTRDRMRTEPPDQRERIRGLPGKPVQIP